MSRKLSKSFYSSYPSFGFEVNAVASPIEPALKTPVVVATIVLVHEKARDKYHDVVLVATNPDLLK